MNVALRSYNREIETLIDQGQTDEAVAHCLHILKTFPKHLETYRLLGKAYLQSHRYQESEDIFQRVLLASPDDFVSQLGMSIVSEDQDDLPGAIWHMERAFEVNSTNNGVLSELRRLYGLRDGSEPARIHLTRGALCHIYTNAGEFQQAIDEIKSILAEDNTRNDLKTLLARAYFHADMKNEAIATCFDLINLYPYNLDANLILLNTFPATDQGQNLDQYRKRIHSLDPYAEAALGPSFDPQTVPDNTIMLERLDSEAQAAALPPIPPPTPPAPEVQPHAEMPDWLRQSGWSPATLPEKPVEEQSQETSANPQIDDLAQAEIPDWVKSMAPPASAEQPPQESGDPDFEWLNSLGIFADSSAPAPAESALTAGKSPLEPALPSGISASEEDLDWLNSLETLAAPPAPAPAGSASSASEDAVASPLPASPIASEEDLDWLNSLETLAAPAAAETQAPAGTELEPALTASTPEKETDPEWLDQLKTLEIDTGSTPEPITKAEMPAWLRENIAEEETSAQAAPLIPDWTRELNFDSSSFNPSAEPNDVQPSEPFLDLAATGYPPAAAETPEIAKTDQRFESETLGIGSLLDASQSPSKPLDLEAASQTADDNLPAFAGISGENLPTWDQPEPDQSEAEKSLAWLRSLEEDQNLVESSPSPANEEPLPDWFSDQPVTEESAPFDSTPVQPEEIPASSEEAQPIFAAEEPMPDWFSDQPVTEESVPFDSTSGQPEKTPAPSEEVQPVSAVEEPLPDWFSDQPVTEESASVETTAAALTVEATPPSEEAQPIFAAEEPLPDWFSDQPVSEESVPVETTPAPSEEVQPVSAVEEPLPDWFSDQPVTEESAPIDSSPAPAVETPAPSEEVQPVSAVEELLPDWFSDQPVSQETTSLESNPAPAIEAPAQPAEPQLPEKDQTLVVQEEPLPDWTSRRTTTAETPESIQAGAESRPPTPEDLAAMAETRPNPRVRIMNFLHPAPAAAATPAAPAKPEIRVEDLPRSEPKTEPEPEPAPVPENEFDWLGDLAAPLREEPLDTESTSAAQAMTAAPAALESEPLDLDQLPELPEDQAAVESPQVSASNLPGAGNTSAETAGSNPEAAKLIDSFEKSVPLPGSTVDEVTYPDWLNLPAKDETVTAGPIQPNAEAPADLAAETGTFEPVQPAAEPPAAFSQVDEESQQAKTPARMPWETDLSAMDEVVADETNDSEEKPYSWLFDKDEKNDQSVVASASTDLISGEDSGDEDAGVSPANVTSLEELSPSQPETIPTPPPHRSLSDETSDWLASLEDEPAPQSTSPLTWEPASPAVPAEPQTIKPPAVPEPGFGSKVEIDDWLHCLDGQENPPRAEEPEHTTQASSAALTEETPILPEAAQEPPQEASAQPEAVPEMTEEIPVLPEEASSIPGEAPASSAEVSPTPAPSIIQQSPDKDQQMLDHARELTSRGTIAESLMDYNRLIRKGKFLDDVIGDLQEAVTLHPQDVMLWQTLGDAYFHHNRLQEALDSYAKAEDLLR